ncbi:hypothetical protein ACFL20_09425, partial [Spirochaetota bacterium]
FILTKKDQLNLQNRSVSNYLKIIFIDSPLSESVFLMFELISNIEDTEVTYMVLKWIKEDRNINFGDKISKEQNNYLLLIDELIEFIRGNNSLLYEKFLKNIIKLSIGTSFYSMGGYCDAILASLHGHKINDELIDSIDNSIMQQDIITLRNYLEIEHNNKSNDIELIKIDLVNPLIARLLKLKIISQ